MPWTALILNLAVIAQWVSLAIFVCTLFQVRR